MSSKKTENLNLHSWVRTDPFSMDEFNENFKAIDEAMGEAASTACKIYAGSYPGDGNYGAEYPTTIEFPFTPKLVLIFIYNYSQVDRAPHMLVWGQTSTIYTGNYTAKVSYNGNTVSYYSVSGGSYQLNAGRTTYHYVAFG